MAPDMSMHLKRKDPDLMHKGTESDSNSQTEEEREDVSLHEHTSPQVSDSNRSCF